MISAVVINFIENVLGSIMMSCIISTVVKPAFSFGIWIFYFSEFQLNMCMYINAILSCFSLCFMVPAACSIFPQRW